MVSPSTASAARPATRASSPTPSPACRSSRRRSSSSTRCWASRSSTSVSGIAPRRGSRRVIVCNMLDRERADFDHALGLLQESFGSQVVAVQLPIGEEHAFSGVVDLLTMKAYTYKDGKATVGDIPADLADAGRGRPRQAHRRGREHRRRPRREVPHGRGDHGGGAQRRVRRRRRVGPALPGRLRVRDGQHRRGPHLRRARPRPRRRRPSFRRRP